MLPVTNISCSCITPTSTICVSNSQRESRQQCISTPIRVVSASSSPPLLLPNGRKYKPRTETLDNVLSADLKDLMTKNGIRPALVSAGNHRGNDIERGIRTAENHLVAMIHSCDPSFDKTAFTHLIEQAEITLNLLRTCYLDPTESAYSFLRGPYDFTRTPMAPPGHPVMVHEPAQRRPKFTSHATHTNAPSFRF